MIEIEGILGIDLSQALKAEKGKGICLLEVLFPSSNTLINIEPANWFTKLILKLIKLRIIFKNRDGGLYGWNKYIIGSSLNMKCNFQVTDELFKDMPEDEKQALDKFIQELLEDEKQSLAEFKIKE